MDRLRRVGRWACVIVLAAAFVMAGASKLRGPSAAHWSERFARWGFPARAHYVVGALELLGGLGVLIPRSRRAAAATLTVVMIGALSTHLAHGEVPRVIPPLVLGGLAVVVYRWCVPEPAVVHPSRDG